MKKGDSRRGREELCSSLCSTGLRPSVASKYLHFRLDIYGVVGTGWMGRRTRKGMCSASSMLNLENPVRTQTFT